MLFATNRIPKEGVKTVVNRKVSKDKVTNIWAARGLEYDICAQESSPKEAIENFGELIGYEHALAKHLGKNLRGRIPEVPQHNGFFNASNSLDLTFLQKQVLIL